MQQGEDIGVSQVVPGSGGAEREDGEGAAVNEGASVDGVVGEGVVGAECAEPAGAGDSGDQQASNEQLEAAVVLGADGGLRGLLAPGRRARGATGPEW